MRHGDPASASTASRAIGWVTPSFEGSATLSTSASITSTPRLLQAVAGGYWCASGAQMTSTGSRSRPRRTRASGEIRRLGSRTTRSRGRDPCRGRGVSRGSSAVTVAIPVRMASFSRRSTRPWRRLRGRVIQRVPGGAMTPSTEIAAFTVTQGVPVRRNLKNEGFSSCASSRRTPVVTSTPADRRRSNPPPRTLGSGSGCEATTRLTPEAMIRSAQGGVRPT